MDLKPHGDAGACLSNEAELGAATGVEPHDDTGARISKSKEAEPRATTVHGPGAT
jgi:hypothetical protein